MMVYIVLVAYQHELHLCDHYVGKIDLWEYTCTNLLEHIGVTKMGIILQENFLGDAGITSNRKKPKAIP